MSRLVALFLAVAVALTSQAFALARGESVAAGEVVICAGGGFVTVALDAQGNPVGPAHFCPDAVMAMAALTVPPVVAPEPVTGTTERAVTVAAVWPATRDVTHAQARAPPIPV